MIRDTSRDDGPRVRAGSDTEKVRICAANNADLYQAIFRAHGLPDRRTSAFWSSEAIAPPYYSNMTTLDPEPTEEQLDEIDRLTEKLGRRPGLKDGFSRLHLASRGYRILFLASWIWAQPQATSKDAPQNWMRIHDIAALDDWEHRWKESGSPTDANVFKPAILSDTEIHIYGRLAGNGFDAGCIVNRSPDAVGISNIFSLNGTPPAFTDAVSLAALAFSSDLPLVGYDSGAALEKMIGLGFKPVGNLRVWLPEDEG